MPTTPNEALARDIISAQKEDLPGPTSPVHRSTGRLWSGVCFAAVLLAVFARPLLSLIGYAATSELHSYALLIPFVSAYLLYLRRDQLPKNYASDVRLGTLFLVAGLGVLAFTSWLDFTGCRPRAWLGINANETQKENLVALRARSRQNARGGRILAPRPPW